MIQNIRKISILNKIFNVNGGQWSKISFSWTINFLYRAAFVICWTMILTVFVGRFGISYLPHLFVINAFFTVLGSIFYSVFIDQFKKEHILAVTVVIAIFITAVANSFARENVILFLALLLVVISVFLNQFKIISNGYSEEMFNPVESERAFPLIETSEVVGGIAAGIAIAVFSDIPIKDFIYLFVAILIATIPCLILCENICKKELKIRKEKEFESKGILSKFKKELSSARHIKFIKGLFLIVLVQWILFNLLEFQYTKAIYQDISGLILDSGSGFEHAFAHELGAMFVLFNVFALVVQIFLGSRFITSLGVIGSMLIHPIITFFSLFGLMFSFGFSSAVFAKNNFTITTTIYTNSYHSAYYAVKESLREHTREFLEGIVRPIGAISGMILL
ncbi:hypothetical protein HZC20_00580, partial [Candidatus Peregrinibacteria bacterium]|nr:hypothetical protein [Candidatus Peregrinibacteria bacterium]